MLFLILDILYENDENFFPLPTKLIQKVLLESLGSSGGSLLSVFVQEATHSVYDRLPKKLKMFGF